MHRFGSACENDTAASNSYELWGKEYGYQCSFISDRPAPSRQRPRYAPPRIAPVRIARQFHTLFTKIERRGVQGVFSQNDVVPVPIINLALCSLRNIMDSRSRCSGTPAAPSPGGFFKPPWAMWFGKQSFQTVYLGVICSSAPLQDMAPPFPVGYGSNLRLPLERRTEKRTSSKRRTTV